MKKVQWEEQTNKNGIWWSKFTVQESNALVQKGMGHI